MFGSLTARSSGQSSTTFATTTVRTCIWATVGPITPITQQNAFDIWAWGLQRICAYANACMREFTDEESPGFKIDADVIQKRTLQHAAELVKPQKEFADEFLVSAICGRTRSRPYGEGTPSGITPAGAVPIAPSVAGASGVSSGVATAGTGPLLAVEVSSASKQPPPSRRPKPTRPVPPMDTSTGKQPPPDRPPMPTRLVPPPVVTRFTKKGARARSPPVRPRPPQPSGSQDVVMEAADTPPKVSGVIPATEGGVADTLPQPSGVIPATEGVLSHPRRLRA